MVLCSMNYRDKPVFIISTGTLEGYQRVADGDYSCKSQWLLYVPPRLLLKNSTFCQHNVFMCFVWTWGQRTSISVHSNKWLVLSTHTAWSWICKSEYLYIHYSIISEGVMPWLTQISMSDRGGPVSIVGQPIMELWWTSWHEYWIFF
jgi:hypothetical protein